jgi:hypothetical protein
MAQTANRFGRSVVMATNELFFDIHGQCGEAGIDGHRPRNLNFLSISPSGPQPFPASSNELNGSSTIGPSHNWTWGFS